MYSDAVCQLRATAPSMQFPENESNSTGKGAVPPPVPKKLKPFVIDVIVKLSMVPVDETAGNPVQTT